MAVQRKIHIIILNESFFTELEASKNDKSSNSDEVLQLQEKLKNERVMKTQAVNKLAEIVQRKPEVGSTKGNNRRLQKLEKMEKNYKKLEFELEAVC